MKVYAVLYALYVCVCVWNVMVSVWCHHACVCFALFVCVCVFCRFAWCCVCVCAAVWLGQCVFFFNGIVYVYSYAITVMLILSVCLVVCRHVSNYFTTLCLVCVCCQIHMHMCVCVFVCVFVCACV
eukprot:GHVQ01018398.1.p3 GENE.GHVQ01018398.1~~GHVQ01018398.1.p3  ORF type:complete len:126 (-),score=15.30 GHVQ01018398.1:1261-1638(-)